jgi:hypothetical protein
MDIIITRVNTAIHIIQLMKKNNLPVMAPAVFYKMG